MTPRSLVNGVPSDRIALADRGLAYGDGVFETILVAQGEAVWWDAHVARLRRGCSVLGIACPSADVLAQEARFLIAGQARAVLKVTVTRGEAGRGYAAPDNASPTRALSLHPPMIPAPDDYERGVALRWCDFRLAIQPRLAGIKHLNRLEQVLARGEWRDPSIADGLLRDVEGRVICATAANLFVVRDGIVFTPALDRCGIEGLCRAWVMQNVPVQAGDLQPAEIETADELFLTSSLRGILPVARLDGLRWTVGAMTRQLQLDLGSEVPALATALDARP